MALFVKKFYSKEDGDYLYGYDLVSDTYLGCRYVVTLGLDLQAYSAHDALQELYKFRGNIYTFDSQKEFMRMFDTNLSKQI